MIRAGGIGRTAVGGVLAVVTALVGAHAAASEPVDTVVASRRDAPVAPVDPAHVRAPSPASSPAPDRAPVGVDRLGDRDDPLRGESWRPTDDVADPAADGTGGAGERSDSEIAAQIDTEIATKIDTEIDVTADRSVGTTMVRVEVVPDPADRERATDAIAPAVERIGGTVVTTAPSGTALVDVPLDRLDRLDALVPGQARMPLALDVAPERDAVATTGPTTGGHESIIGADVWHDAGIVGAGVRIGVVDFFDVPRHWDVLEMGPTPVAGVTALCLDEGADCSQEEFFDSPPPGGDHGPAVVEIIKDVAPGAEILIGRAGTEADYYAVIDWFADQGVDIVSRSLGSRYDGPGDGRGPLDDIADHAVDRGMLWVNSGGNNARNRYYRQPARVDAQGAVLFGPSGTDRHLQFNRCIQPGGVRWANDWDLPAAARTDYAVTIVDAPTGDPEAGTVVAVSDAKQIEGAAPLERFSGRACPSSDTRSLYLSMRLVAGDPSGDVIEILDYDDGMSEYVQAQYSAATSVVDSRNPGVVAVGAIDPGAGTTAADYSSRGPTNDERVKPDLTAPSGLPSTTFGGTFSGTSAAAPVASAAAALLLDAGLARGARELGDLLRHTTVDRGPTGPDPTYGVGELRLPPPPAGSVSTAPSVYVPLDAPVRFLDTRPTAAVGPTRLVGRTWPGEILDLPVVGVGGVPASGVTAVAVNVTLVDADRTGYGQVLPTFGAAVGDFSTFNLDAEAQTRPNFAIVPVGADGRISIYANTGGHVLVDVLGSFVEAGDEPTAGRVVGLATPIRAIDTRLGAATPLASREVVTFPVPSNLTREVPIDEIAALVLTVTGTGASTPTSGFVQALPGDELSEVYRTSTLNLGPGDTAANTVIVPVTGTGVSVYADLGDGGSVHVIADVTGYVTSDAAPAAAAGRFVAVSPARAVDTRTGPAPVDDDGDLAVVAGDAPGVTVPADASGVVWNLTATATQRYGFLQAWAAGGPVPATSALNWTTAGTTIASGAVIRPDADGTITVRATDLDPTTDGPLTHVLADVFGYFT